MLYFLYYFVCRSILIFKIWCFINISSSHIISSLFLSGVLFIISSLFLESKNVHFLLDVSNLLMKVIDLYWNELKTLSVTHKSVIFISTLNVKPCCLKFAYWNMHWLNPFRDEYRKALCINNNILTFPNVTKTQLEFAYSNLT